MSGQRLERLEASMREELSEIVSHQLRDPRIGGLVSVTGIDLSRDLKLARVHISIMGDDETRRRTLKGLEQARGFMRSELGRRFRIRQVPELVFRLDDSIERGARVIDLMSRDGGEGT